MLALIAKWFCIGRPRVLSGAPVGIGMTALPDNDEYDLILARVFKIIQFTLFDITTTKQQLKVKYIHLYK